MYDEERRPTGQVAERFGGFPDGGLHLVVHVCVFDARGRMLIQRRQKTKAAWQMGSQCRRLRARRGNQPSGGHPGNAGGTGL